MQEYWHKIDLKIDCFNGNKITTGNNNIKLQLKLK